MPLSALTARLGDAARTLTPRAGDVLFRQGDRTRGMFLLKEGRVRLVRHTPDGHEVPLHPVCPGESFAEPSLFAERYHCDCLCERDSRVILLPRAAMLSLLQRDARAASTLIARLAGQVRDLRTRAELRNIHGAPERLMAALRLRVDDATGHVRLSGTLKALAGELGMAHETLYRALKKLEAQGAISRAGGHIHILNTPRP